MFQVQFFDVRSTSSLSRAIELAIVLVCTYCSIEFLTVKSSPQFSIAFAYTTSIVGKSTEFAEFSGHIEFI